MPHARDRSLIWCLPFLILLGGCEARPECDSSETRLAVLQTVSDDHRNPLATYAAQNPNVAKEKSSTPASQAEKSSDLKKPLYALGDKIVTTSTSPDKRTLRCSGSISATVGNTKASKEVDFTVQQSDGKISVSVDPFQF